MHILTGLVMAAAALGPDIAPPPQVDAVLAAERQIAQAQVDNDVAAVDALLVDGYTFTLPDGAIVPKATFLANMREWWRPLVVENTKQEVRLLGQTAIISGEARYRWRSDGKPEEEARERYTDTYVLEGGRWRRAASHSSCLSGRCT